MKLKKQTLSKVLSVVLTLSMLLSFTACGERENTQKPDENTQQEQDKEPEKKPEEESKPDTDSEAEVKTPELKGKIAEIKAKNNDVVGWLQIPDTEVNAAVVHTTNNDFYMRKNELKEYSWTGSYFADYECKFGPKRDSLLRSTLIYGHNVNYDDGKDKERFSQLFKFADIEFAKDHPYIYFSLPEEELVWEIFATAYTTTDFNYIQILKDRKANPTEQITEAQMMNIVNGMRDRSEYDYHDVEVSGSDKILILSTCSYKYGRRNDVRFVIMAKLLPADAKLHAKANITANADKKAVA